MATYKEILAGLTPASAYQALLDLLKGKGLPVLSWASGDPIPVMLEHGFARVLSTLYGFASSTARGMFISGARYLAEQDLATWEADPEATFLWHLATQVYRVTPQPPAFAEQTLLLTNSSAAALPVPASLLVRTATGLVYRMNEAAAVTVPGNGTSFVKVKAEKAGPDYNVAAGQINQLVSTVAGLTVSNQPQPPATTPVLVFGGFRQRPADVEAQCLANWGRLARLQTAPADAYRALALDSSVTGSSAVKKVAVWPHHDPDLPAPGNKGNAVGIYLAGDAAPVPPALAVQVQAALLPYIGLHDTLKVRPSGTVTYLPTGTVIARQAADVPAIIFALVAAQQQLQVATQIGQTVTAFAVRRAVAAIPQVKDFVESLTDFVPAKNALVTISFANFVVQA